MISLKTIGRMAYHKYIEKEKRRHYFSELEALCQHMEMKKLPIDYERSIREFYSKYGIKKIDLQWHQYIYSTTSDMNPAYIPETFYHIDVEPLYTNPRSEWEDKAYMQNILSGINFPNTIMRNVNHYFIDNEGKIIDRNDALEIIRNKDKKLIIKPTLDSGGGRGVCAIDSSLIDEEVLLEFDKNYIIQDCITQHKILNSFNESSVNTEKIISFLHRGEVYILTSILRVGEKGAITDTASTGRGYTVGIKEDGSLNEIGYNIFGDKYYANASGVSFRDIVLPAHTIILETIKECHKRLPYFGLISWDFATGEKGEPILIEYNLGYPDILIYQMNTGPIFGDLTDMVLQEVSKY